MENRYPLFAGGRILKKEALWDLRDYAYGGWQLYYADYTDGILKGCNVRVEGMNLVIGKGILKYRNFIYFLQEEATVPYAAENRQMILKAAFGEKPGNPDYLAHTVYFFLDDNPERQENQIELCRFHLRMGSVLRDTYKDFSDFNTEYDTINLLYTTMAGRVGGRMNPEILLRYAYECQKSEANSIEDTAFCYNVMQNKGEVERNVLEAYLKNKLSEEIPGDEDRRESGQYYKRLASILNQEADSRKNAKKPKVIFVE